LARGLEEFAKKDFYDTVHECPFCGRRLSTEPIDVKIRVKTNTRAVADIRPTGPQRTVHPKICVEW